MLQKIMHMRKKDDCVLLHSCGKSKAGLIEPLTFLNNKLIVFKCGYRPQFDKLMETNAELGLYVKSTIS